LTEQASSGGIVSKGDISLKYIIPFSLIMLSACNVPYEIPVETSSDMTTEEICKRIVSAQNTKQNWSNEMFTSLRDDIMAEMNDNIAIGIKELSTRGFTEDELFYIRTGRLVAGLNDRTRACITSDPF
jgi:hypothetical protein